MIKYKDFVCFIPLRSGSKGVINKNVRSVGYKPLFMHTIQHAMDAGFPSDRVVVSTNDPFIEKVVLELNLTLVKRPDGLCQDNCSTESAMLHALNFIPKSKHMILLQATSPFRDAKLIQSCIEKYTSSKYDSLLTVLELPNFFWTKKSGSDEYEPTYDPKKRPPRQLLKPEDYRYFDNGCLYISNIEMLKKTESRLGEKVCVFPISYMESFQIDDETELKQANAIKKADMVV